MGINAQNIQFLLSQVSASGVVLSNGKAYFYAAGTSTDKAVWTDRAKTAEAANPYTLDVNGTAQLYADGVYRIVIKDAAGVVKFDRDYLNFADQNAELERLTADAIVTTAKLLKYVSDYGTLAEAVAEIGGTNATIVFDEDQTILAPITVPLTLELLPLDGAVINRGVYAFTYNGSTARWPKVQIFSGTGTVAGFSEVYPEWFGSNTIPGTTDMTAAMTAAHATGAKVVYGKTAYKFTGSTLDFSGGIEVDPETIFTNGRYDKIIQFDRSGSLIGLMHNHMEQKGTADAVQPAITSGSIVAPPMSRTAARGNVDLIAYWYQDFGLDAIRDSAVGWKGWYTWEWAHTDSAVDLTATPKKRGYLPNRHPLLGWYRGDDANVLDWQCYWLREAGISAVVVQPRATNHHLGLNGTWTTTAGIDNWIYKLLNSVPNAAGLGIIPWVASGSDGSNYGNAGWATAAADAWEANMLAVHSSGKAYTVTMEGKKYITVFMWSGESLRGDLDNYSGSTNTAAFLANRADYAKTLGYDGVAVMVRSPTSNTLMNRGARLADGVLYFGATYGSSSTTFGTTYADAVAAWDHNAVPLVSVPSVRLEALSSNHPTDWGQSGSTPDMFRQMLAKAIRYARKTPNCPKMVTIYNISEWAEGGASLQPTVGAGWAYLDAVRHALTSAASPEIPLEGMVTYYKPTGTLTTMASRIAIGSDVDSTYAYTPLLADGTYEGQTVTIVNYEAVAAKTITLADDRVTAGTKLFFRAGVNLTLSPWQSVTLMWFPSKGWVEL